MYLISRNGICCKQMKKSKTADSLMLNGFVYFDLATNFELCALHVCLSARHPLNSTCLFNDCHNQCCRRMPKFCNVFALRSPLSLEFLIPGLICIVLYNTNIYTMYIVQNAMRVCAIFFVLGPSNEPNSILYRQI